MGKLTKNPALHDLACTIERHAPKSGDYQTTIAALSFYRRHAPTEPIPCIYPLGLALTTQGDKRVLVGNKILEYFPGQSLVTTLEQPVISHITRATEDEPYLGLLLKLDARLVALTAAGMKMLPADNSFADEPISIENLDPALLNALQRLVKLLDEPILMPQLAPLIEQEIIIRLLSGPHGMHLRQLMLSESPNQRIDRVIIWLKQHYTQAVRVDDLAAKANMSLSTFRQHFRSVTGMAPMQYQKQLRLQEARQLMLNKGMSASNACLAVGYESASQFSREYSRFFKISPQRDAMQKRTSDPSNQAMFPLKKA